MNKDTFKSKEKMTNKEIERLETKLMTLGLNGLAYSSIWNDTAKKLKEIKNEKQGN